MFSRLYLAVFARLWRSFKKIIINLYDLESEFLLKSNRVNKVKKCNKNTFKGFVQAGALFFSFFFYFFDLIYGEVLKRFQVLGSSFQQKKNRIKCKIDIWHEKDY